MKQSGGMGRYRLEGREPVLEEDLLNWAAWLNYADRRVAQTDVGPLRVSTIFLGLDHGFSGTGPPILFETLVFGGEPIILPGGRVSDFSEIEGRRYATWAEAEAGHAELIAWATAKLAALDIIVILEALKAQK